MSGRLFHRIAQLTVWRARPDSFFTSESNAIVISDLRVRFSCEKNVNAEPNKCEVIVSNLAPETRSAMEHKPLMVRLEAGYLQPDGTRQLSRMFSGDLRRASSRRDGTDWETTLQVADGDRAYRHARVGKTFKAGTTAADVAAAIATAMNITIAASALPRLRAVTFSKGKTVHGPAHREMTKLVDAVPLMAPGSAGGGTRSRWSIQDGQLQVLGDDEVRPGQAIVVSQATGMVGSPAYGSPTESKKPPTLTAKTLLFPSAVPGGSMEVVSASINGFFRIERVRHTGDTHGEDWYTDMEARPR